MSTITIQDIKDQSLMTKVDANELNEIHGGGIIRDALHFLVDVICNYFEL
jgi:hypothetical protein